MLTVIGEALIDEVVHGEASPVPHVGGSPMNVAVGLARLGLPTKFFGRWGTDNYGGAIAEHLKDNSVLVATEPDEFPTSVARAQIAHDGAATYSFDLHWELPDFGGAGSAREGLADSALADSTLVHAGSIAAMLAPGSEQVYQSVLHSRSHATISYDPNCRPTIITDVNHARSQAERFVALADVVKASDEDLQWLYPELTVEQAARNWLAAGPALVVVTRGGDGPWAVCAAGEATAAAPTVSVADTVGAGDSFMSALIGALVDRELDGAARRPELRGISTKALGEVLDFAARAAAITVSRAGANPPSRAEVRAATRQGR